jgi:exodeoxyribonuclease V alpha subunit
MFEKEENLSDIDRILANWIFPEGPLQAQAVICFLSASTREGHLCITKQSPDPELFFQQTPDIKALIKSGFDQIKDHPALVMDQERLYFKRHFESESQAWNEIKRIVSAQVPPIPCHETILNLPLLPEQKSAALHVLDHPLTLITGGPGTGKTTTCAHLIRTILTKMPELKIAIAAPTGKAAMHLERSLNLETIKGRTVHSLLQAPLPLPFDLILIDESSMIDAAMMADLLKGVKQGARLVLLGDPHQLPPVGAGALFSDFTEVPDWTFALKTCLRTDLSEILDFANAVKNGDLEILRQMPLFPLGSPEEIVKEVAGFFDREKSFSLLTPMRQGPFGTDALNALFLEFFIKKWDRKESFKAPIMIAKNSKRLQLSNGEVGILVRQKGLEPSFGDYALFGQRKIPAALLPKFEWAWALSVHKSQGSEFDQVVMLLPEGSQSFGRKVLYTGATRARKSLQIWGEQQVLQQTVVRPGLRLSRSGGR